MSRRTIRLADIAERVGGTLSGDPEKVISNLTSIESAESDDLTFLVNAAGIERLKNSRAGAALIPLTVDEELNLPVIRVKDPNLASALIHNYLLLHPFAAQGVHPRACIGDDCHIPEKVTIGPLAVIGDRVTIGQRVCIEPGVVVGDDVSIGDDVTLKANVTIYEKCLLANRIIIHSGTVIGSDGYGYATDAMGNHVKKPQVGRVRIDDDVEIGANVCIDRGAFGDTWIQAGVKIDNQVQVAHNVVIGPNSLIVAQVGIAGSTTLGRNVVLGGKAAINGHIHLDDQTMVAAGSGVHGSLPKKSMVGGVPAIPIKKWAKATAVYARLPELYSDFRKLTKQVAVLQDKLSKLQSTGDKND